MVTPSLLPRDALFQGLIQRHLGRHRLPAELSSCRSWSVLISRSSPWPDRRTLARVDVVALAGTPIMLFWFSRSQDEIRDLMGMSRNRRGTPYPAIALVSHRLRPCWCCSAGRGPTPCGR